MTMLILGLGGGPVVVLVAATDTTSSRLVGIATMRAKHNAAFIQVSRRGRVETVMGVKKLTRVGLVWFW